MTIASICSVSHARWVTRHASASATASSKPTFEKLAPHLYLQVYPAKLVDDELAEFLLMLERRAPTLERPHAWVADFGSIQSASAQQRKAFAEFQRRTEPIDRLHNAGSALVVCNALVRGFVTAVSWLAPPAYPMHVVETREQGIRWAAAQLRSRGVRVDLVALVGSES